MTVHYDKLLRAAAKVSALALITVSLCAWDIECSTCGDRTEFVTRGAGDAVEVNKATQTIDPWPPYVKNRKLNLDGQRAGLAMERYQTNRVLRPRPLNAEKPAETVQPENALQAPTPQQ